MKSRLLVLTFVSLFLTLHFSEVTALTMKQVSGICHSSPGKCSDHPIVRAYIGGALDLIATLDEQTDYLKKVYCKNPKEIFDMRAIIRYMESRSEQYATKNAMLVLVRYFEENGGCHP